ADQMLVEVGRTGGDFVYLGYDSAGRPLSVRDSLTSVSFVYDSVGRPASITGGNGETLTYDYASGTGPLVRTVTWKGTIGGGGGVFVHHDFDSDFRLSSESVNNQIGYTVSYGYDADSLLTQAGALTVARCGAPACGDQLQAGCPNMNGSASSGLIADTCISSGTAKVTDTYTYNYFGEKASYSSIYTSASNQTSNLLNVVYDTGANPGRRDNLGRIAQKTETIGNGSAFTYNYTYDKSGRLTDVTNGNTSVEHYAYDLNGNRTVATNSLNVPSALSSTPTYDAQDRLTNYPATSGAITFTYSAPGERMTRTVSGMTTKYTYDAFGNLLVVILPNGTRIDYLVDGQNRRIGKMVNGTWVQGFIYGSQLGPVAELDGHNNVVSRFVYGTHANVPDYIIRADGSIHRVITDHLGSVRQVVNVADGTIDQHLEYDSFGNLLSSSTAYPTTPGVGGTWTAAFQPFGFAGGLYDPDTNLVRFGARDYDPQIGRWTTKDALGFRGGDTNVYAYAVNDPINVSDPKGEAIYTQDFTAALWLDDARQVPAFDAFYRMLDRDSTAN
ncbi:MAG TPA: RHS repeat-associated core domain-containing protein, partial [Chloroflexota bacterium]|nr:RHS repeat-associated core domain-containing protein [Chloroflexota bacterium]